MSDKTKKLLTLMKSMEGEEVFNALNDMPMTNLSCVISMGAAILQNRIHQMFCDNEECEGHDIKD